MYKVVPLIQQRYLWRQSVANEIIIKPLALNIFFKIMIF